MAKNLFYPDANVCSANAKQHAAKSRFFSSRTIFKRPSLTVFFLLLSTIFLIGFSASYAQNISTIAGNGTYGYTGDGGPATSAEIWYPGSVAVDNKGNVYIGGNDDYYYYYTSTYSRVRKVNAYGIISTFAGTGTSGFSGDGGAATAAEIEYPGGVATDPIGNLYFIDEGNARIRKVDTSGIITTIAGTGTYGDTGDGGPATSANIAGGSIAIDDSGNIYFGGWDDYYWYSGGSYYYYWNIRKINTSGIISAFAGTGTSGFSGDGGPATSALLGYVYGLAADHSGNVYIDDESNQRIRIVNSSGIISTFAGTGTAGFLGDGGPATAARFYDPLGIAVDGAGNLIITDYANQRMRKVNSAGIISTIAGTGTAGFYGDGGPATAAHLYYPWGVAVDGPGNVYIADWENIRVRKITNYNRPCFFTKRPSQNLTVCENTSYDSINSLLPVFDSDYYQPETWAVLSGPSHGGVIGAYTTVSGCDTMHPHGMYYTPTFGYSGLDTFKETVTDGYVYDTITIYVTVNPIPSVITGNASCSVGSYTTLLDSTSGGTWSGTTSVATVGGSTGLITGLAVGTPTITYTLPTGCINTATVNIFAYAGQLISTIAGNGAAGSTGDGGAALSAELSAPWGVAVDAVGNKYIADYSNNKIRKVSPAGIITTIAGTGAGGFYGDGSAATLAQLNHPYDVAVDASGNVYIADDGNYRIRKVNTSGIITTIAGNGTSTYPGDGVAATAAGLYAPSGVAIDGAGNVYIAVDGTHVRKVNTSGIISTFAGNGSTTYVADGIAATSNGLNNPVSVAVDVSGNVYIADQLSNHIRKVNTSGIMTTIAGTSSAGFSGDGSPATGAALYNPWGIATDPLGNIYIGDHGNNRVRKINTSGIINTIAGNGTLGYGGDACAATAGELYSHWGICTDNSGNIYVADGGNNRVRRISSNHAPLFTGGHNLTSSMCENSIDSLDGLLTILDVDSAQGEAWSSFIAPTHGTLSVTYSGTSTGGTLIPSGLIYTPTLGYTGSDSFRVMAADCAGGYDTTKVVVNVSPPPSAISGAPTVCPGLTTLYSDPVGTGVWSSNDTTKAKVGASSGVVTGIAAGVAVITYAPGASCSVTKTITVSPAPHAIAGPNNVCNTDSILLSDSTTGGVWSSSSTSIATAGSSSGVVTGSYIGSGAGVVTVTYTAAGGCIALSTVTVNVMPAYITGVGSVCTGSSTGLYDGGSGYWSSSAPLVAPVDSLGGLVSGASAGSATISYTLYAGGCNTTFPVVVYPLPSAVTGVGSVCSGFTTTLSDSTAGGYWSVSGLGFSASVDTTTGIVTGLTAGTTTIAYTLFLSGCASTMDVTVNNSPSPITTGSAASVCAGSPLYLYDVSGTGTWSASNGAATVGPTGIVTGVFTGMDTVSFTQGGCPASIVVTVNPSPTAISGSLHVCTGVSTPLSDSVSGGSWASGSPGTASVTSTGMVTGGTTAGTATIFYTMPSGCRATAVVTVNSNPGAILGTPKVCVGLTTALSDPPGAGTWSSGNPLVATVGATGIVTGVSAGTTYSTDTITYSLGAGCTAKAVVTVNPLPGAVSGTEAVCSGSTVTLTGPGAGTWSGGLAGTATVSSGGVVTGGATSGTAPVTFTLTATGCPRTATVTVNPLPSVISGTGILCAGGGTTSLGSLPLGGAWSAVPGTVAAASGTSGTVTGGIAGTATVTYTLPVTGCARTKTVTVNAQPSVITGTMHVCAGQTTPLSDSVGGGTWSTASSTASVGATGIVTGISGGPAVVTYASPDGCARTATVTVNPSPTPISGPSAVCVHATISLLDGGGTWSSSNPSVGTIATTGTVTGIATGTTIIGYTLPTGCTTTTTVTVSLSPVAITGAGAVCSGATVNLTDSVGGGVWSSSTATAATVGSLSGIVSGITPGASTTITYSLGTGCTVTKTVTVTASPGAITGGGSLCAGTTLTLTPPSGSGTWSSGAAAATVTTSGVVHGVAAGTAPVSYTITATGCPAIAVITVNPTPGAITGPSGVCVGATITEADTSAGGIWSTANTNISLGGTGGITGVTGISSGPATITYTIGAPGCIATKTVTVNTVSPITGATGLCMGTTATLSDAAGGGSWSTAPGGVVTIAPTGVVTAGLTTGAAIITYSLGTGCATTTTVNVNTGPTPVGGTLQVCVGDTTWLNDLESGGTWSTGAAGILVVPSTGAVVGITPGTDTVAYSLGSGCTVKAAVTVNASPAAITGTPQVCTGATTALATTATGGLWTSSPGIIATVTPTGSVSGVSAGTAIISYTVGICAATKIVTVNATPSAITGTAAVCAGMTTNLTDTTGIGTGIGTWSPATGSIATVDATGVVTGVAPGTALVSYTLPTGCAATKTVTVNTAPDPITGLTGICIGATTALSDLTTGGAWSSPGTTGIVSLSPTGVVTGMGLGTAAISYSTGAVGCPAVITVTVNSLPGPIGGSPNVCLGTTDTLSDIPGGGVWSSSNILVTTIGSANGVLSGVAPGTATIYYSLGAACTVNRTVTVHPSPAAISGPTNVCAGHTATLSDPATGGVWSSGSTAIATISPVGVVTGVSGGIATITCMVPIGSGISCPATYAVAVTEVPAITGVSNMCAYGATLHLSDSTPGGAWTSTLVSISPAGVVTSYAAGPATIYYTLSSGCYVEAPLTVNPLPDPITGNERVCTGMATTLGELTSGGTWSSSDSATADPTATGTGIITGMTPGTATISYTLPTGCMQAVTVTVSALPSVPAAAGSGAANLCVGASLLLGDVVAGGTWSTVTTGVVSVGSVSGMVTGLSAGTANITYTVAPACAATRTVTVNPVPAVYNVTGGGNYCSGGTGMAVGLSGTQAGTSYQLYLGTAAAGSAVTGTGGAITFGPETAAGVYKATATNTAGCGNAMADSAVITITPTVSPTVSITTTPSDTLCAGTSATFMATATNGGATPAYQWQVNGAAVTGATNTTYTYTPANGDMVTVLLTSDAACATPDTVSRTTAVTVDPNLLPVVTINAHPGTTILTGENDTLSVTWTGAGTSPTYQWYVNGAAVPGATNATYTSNNLAGGDSVNCVVTPQGTCGQPGTNGVKITTFDNVGIKPLTPEGEPSIWPNPAKDELNVINAANTEMKIVNLLGQQVWSGKLTTANEVVNIGELIPGIYVVEITDPSTSLKFTKRLVIAQ